MAMSQVGDNGTLGRGGPVRGFLGARPFAYLSLVLLLSAVTRVFRLGDPGGALIFDEAYYVNAARVMIHIHPAVGASYAGAALGFDPNREHPPLGKLLVAGSMSILGDNPVGWRLPAVLAGLASILLIYLVVVAAGGGRWQALLAATLFSIDNLVLVHSRIAVLDIFLLAFMLFGAWAALRGWPWLAGLGCALATLVKINGTYAVLALLVFYGMVGALAWLRDRRPPRRELISGVVLLAVFLPAWLGGLFLLDRAVTHYTNPLDHIAFMTRYGLALRHPGGPANIESYPWQWLINEVQIPYLRVDQSVGTGPTDQLVRALVYFRGAMNPVLIGSFPLAAGYTAWRAVQLRDRLSLFLMAWLVGAYLPYYLLSVFGERTSYIFYFLPSVPVVAISIAQLLRDPALPRVATWVYLAAALGAFAGYFPFRTLG